MSRFPDPTRAELLRFLAAAYPRITGEPAHDEAACPDGCGCRFDIEEAAYYLACHYHHGQGSRLYAALSASPFTPGPLTTDDLDPESPGNQERLTACLLYQEGSNWIAGEGDYDSRGMLSLPEE